ncbi:MAG: ABC transporter permease [SAR202 cluster bacterium]|nr:ABC transporter permease [SAR202 cluster bacterium]
MGTYIIRRVIATIPVLLVVALIIFSLIHLAPGDPAAIIVGSFAGEEAYQRVRAELGLDKPIIVQLGIWFKNLFQGNLGQSLSGKTPVLEMIRDRMLPTFAIAILTEIFSVVLAIPLGVLAAWKANTWIDRVVMVFSTVGYSIPLFWLGFIFIIVFAVKTHWLPAAGYTHPGEDLGQFFLKLILPVVSTGLVVMALIARMTRATVLEVLQEDYVRTARAKGLADTSVLIRHALRNAILPIITVIGVGFALLLGGVVVTENVFAIPGLGRLLVNAILHRDYPVIQGTILIISAIYAFVNLLVDISYAFLDPRIRYQ